MIAFLKASNQRFQQTMVMITHNPEIAQTADRIIRIEDGRVTAGGIWPGQNGRAMETVQYPGKVQNGAAGRKEAHTDVSGEK